jgi:hypothetical protein
MFNENYMTATFWEADGVMLADNHLAGSFTLVNKETKHFYTFSVVQLCILLMLEKELKHPVL